MIGDLFLVFLKSSVTRTFPEKHYLQEGLRGGERLHPQRLLGQAAAHCELICRTKTATFLTHSTILIVRAPCRWSSCSTWGTARRPQPRRPRRRLARRTVEDSHRPRREEEECRTASTTTTDTLPRVVWRRSSRGCSRSRPILLQSQNQ